MQAFIQSPFFLVLITLLLTAHPTTAFVITGLFGGVNNQTGERPVRQDILKMQSAGEPAWDLYLLSLHTLQQKNHTEQLSWF
jgi:hypothetical protein